MKSDYKSYINNFVDNDKNICINLEDGIYVTLNGL